jgi:anthranilate/para-aminobenzoate synthase component I
MAAFASPVVVIVKLAPSLAPDEAARRAAQGADPIWISSPGGSAASGSGIDGGADVGILFDAVAADPSTIVRGPSLDALEEAWAAARRAWSSTGTLPGAEVPVGIGWLSYDLARQWMPLRAQARDEGEWPPIEFRFYDAIWIRAVGRSAARILACNDAAANRLLARLERPSPGLSTPRMGPLTGPSAAPEQRAAHGMAVARIKEYLLAGDAYQVNLARQLTAPISDGDPVWMAAALRSRAPAPHAFWVAGRSHPGGAVDRYIVGNSPERFLRVTVDRGVETRPIKGTRPRDADERVDAAARGELKAAPKDRAEHVMIVDLERNDLGRVCEAGSVVVESFLRVVELPTVFHLVSTVRGRLRSEVGLPELVRATFPGGSVTGAPKRRAMEIIEELEPVRRGVYTGATGWLGAAGDLDLAIAIRTATVAAGRASLLVGGGIVFDSEAAAEWEETEVKARAFVDLCRQRE